MVKRRKVATGSPPRPDWWMLIAGTLLLLTQEIRGLSWGERVYLLILGVALTYASLAEFRRKRG